MMKDENMLVSHTKEASGKGDKEEGLYREWILEHIMRRNVASERRRRLEERDDHGERLFAVEVWQPVTGSFEYLHPEYEVNDYKDGSRFLDFAYIRPPYRISIEIDGYGAHQRNASRRLFGDDRFRQNQLVLDGWTVVRFSYDDVRDKPRQCQQFLQQLLGKRYGLGHTSGTELLLSVKEREVLRWAQRRRHLSAFSPKEAATTLGAGRCTSLKVLHGLLQKELLEQASGGQRIRTYRLTSKAAGMVL